MTTRTPRGGRVRRVSFLIDLGGGGVGSQHDVRLLTRRLLAHFAKQRPAPPRWCVRFYDSGLSPHAFDAKLRARADEVAAAMVLEHETRERERNTGSDSRVHSWVDEHTRETAGVSGYPVRHQGQNGGARDGNNANNNTSFPRATTGAARNVAYRDFDACDVNSGVAFEAHYDDALSLYHRRDDTGKETVTQNEINPLNTDSKQSGEVSKRTKPKSEKNLYPRVDEAGWFTTLARQMNVALQDGRAGASGGGTGGAAEDDAETYGVMLVLSRVGVGVGASNAQTLVGGQSDGQNRPSSVAPLAQVAAFEEKQLENVHRAFGGIKQNLRKEKVVAHLLRLPFSECDNGNGLDVDTNQTTSADDARATRRAWRRATTLFAGFQGCALPASLIAHTAPHLPPCAAMAYAAAGVANALDGKGAPLSKDGASDFGDFGSLAAALDWDGVMGASGFPLRKYDTGTAQHGLGTRTRDDDTLVEIRIDVDETRGASLGPARLLEREPFGRTDRNASAAKKQTTTMVTLLTVTSLVSSEDTPLLQADQGHERTTREPLVVLVDPVGPCAALGALLALKVRNFPNHHTPPARLPILVLRRDVFPLTVRRPITRARAFVAVRTTATTKDIVPEHDEEDVDAMATQETHDTKPAKEEHGKTSVVVTNRFAILAPMFTGALSLRFLETETETERSGKEKETVAAVAALAPLSPDDTRASQERSWAPTLFAHTGLISHTPLWGCLESWFDSGECAGGSCFHTDHGDGGQNLYGQTVGAKGGPGETQDFAQTKQTARDTSRPFAFASSPEYKPSRALVDLAPNTKPFPGEAKTVSVLSQKTLTDCLVDAARNAPTGTHRWEAWFGDGPGICGDLGDKITDFNKSMARDDWGGHSARVVSANRADQVLCLPPATTITASDDDLLAAADPKNVTSVLTERFDAMLSGRPVDASVFAKLALGENGDSQSSGSDGGQDASVSDGAVDNADDDADDDDAHVFGDANTAVATSNRGRVVGTFANLADLDAVQSAAQTAYERVVADIFSTSPSDPDPDLASAAAALAGSVLEAFDHVLMLEQGFGGDSPDPYLRCAKTRDAPTRARGKKQSTNNSHDLAQRAVCKTAKELRLAHTSTGPSAKANKRREHLLQVHLRFCCLPSEDGVCGSAGLAGAETVTSSAGLTGLGNAVTDVKASANTETDVKRGANTVTTTVPNTATNSSITMDAKTIAKLISAVTFLLNPVGLDGVRLFADKELTPLYSGKVPKLLAGVRSELGVETQGAQRTGGGGDNEAGDTTVAARTGGAAVFSPTAPAKKPERSFIEKAAAAQRPGKHDPNSHALVLVGHDPRHEKDKACVNTGKLAPVTTKPGGAKSWHPVFRSRATRVVRQVTMTESLPLAKPRTKQQIELEKADLVQKQRSVAAASLIERDGAAQRGGKSASKWRFNTSNRLAKQSDGNGNQGTGGGGDGLGQMPAPRRLAFEFGSGNTPGSGEGGNAASTPAPARGVRGLVNFGGGLETPARQPIRNGNAVGKLVGETFGRTYLPNLGGLETPAAPKARVKATPHGKGTGGKGTAGRSSGRGESMVIAATPFGERVKGTPMEKLGGSGAGGASDVNAAAAKKRKEGKKTGLASFGAMVREGREAEETEMGGGKRRRI